MKKMEDRRVEAFLQLSYLNATWQAILEIVLIGVKLRDELVNHLDALRDLIILPRTLSATSLKPPSFRHPLLRRNNLACALNSLPDPFELLFNVLPYLLITPICPITPQQL